MDDFHGPSERCGSASSTEVSGSTSSMTSSEKFAIASQLISQLANLVEGPPGRFLERIAVLRDIKDAWAANKEVNVVTQDDSYDSVSDDASSAPRSTHMVNEEIGSDSEDAVIATFQALGSSAPLNFVIKQEPAMLEIDHALENSNVGTPGYADRAPPLLEETGRPLADSLETGHFSQEEAGLTTGWGYPEGELHRYQTSAVQQGRLNTSKVFEDLGNHRVQLMLKKLDIKQAGNVRASEDQMSSGDDAGSEDAEPNGSDFKDDIQDDATKDWSDSDANTQQISTSKAGLVVIGNKRKKLLCIKCSKSFSLGEVSPTQPFACPHCQQHASKQGPRQGVACVNTNNQSRTVTPVSEVDTCNTSKPLGIPSRPYPCNLCTQAFTNNSHLRDHLLTHSKEKPFRCRCCDRPFRTSSNRNSHEKTHRGKIFPTGHLSMEGSVQNQTPTAKKLSKHHNSTPKLSGAYSDSPGLIYNGDRSGISDRYPCDVCEVTFSTAAALDFHRKGHRISCKTCGIFFPTKSDLRQHKGNCHNTSPSKHVQQEKNRPTFGPIAIRKKYERLRMTKKTYQCPICKKVLKTPGGFRTHKMIHANGPRHTCIICPKSFNTSSQLNTHMRIHTGERPFSCHLCTQRFTQRSHLLNHWQSVHKGEIYRCRHCPRIFLEQTELTAHEQKQHQWLQESSPTKQDLLKNVDTEASDLASTSTSASSKRGSLTAAVSHNNLFNCAKCEKVFKNIKGLQCHSRIHEIDRPFLCPKCPKRFTTKAHLSRHLINLHTVMLFKCDVCAKPFFRESNLREHEKLHLAETQSKGSILKVGQGKKNPKKPAQSKNVDIQQKRGTLKGFGCPHCPKLLTRKDSLIEHIRTHTKEKPFKCKECGKAFSHRSAFRLHEKSHLKPSSRIKCETPFQTEAALNSRMRMQHGIARHSRKSPESLPGHSQHLDDELLHIDVVSGNIGQDMPAKLPLELHKTVNKEKHPCKYCSKVLSRRCRLKRHEKLHTNEENHSCNICNEMYSSTGHLRLHMRTHEKFTSTVRNQAGKKIGEENTEFKCHFCPRVLPNRSSHKDHMRTHTGEKPFACDICKRTFARRYTLYKHQEKLHGKKKPSCKIASAYRSHGQLVPTGSRESGHQLAGASRSPIRNVADANKSYGRKLAKVNKGHGLQPAGKNKSPICKLTYTNRSPIRQVAYANKTHGRQLASENKSPVRQVTKIKSPIHHAANTVRSPSFQGSKLNSPSNFERSPKKQMTHSFDAEQNRKILQCKIFGCGQIFITKELLAKHNKTHTTKNNPEAIPSKRSPSSSRKASKNSSPAKKKYECEDCGKMFTSPSHLSVHYRVHTGERPFSCECGRTFTTKSHMTFHKQKHCKERIQADETRQDPMDSKPKI